MMKMSEFVARTDIFELNGDMHKNLCSCRGIRTCIVVDFIEDFITGVPSSMS